MIVLGVLLVLLAVVAVVAAVARGGAPAGMDLELFSFNTTVLGIFLAGALTLLLLVMGLSLIATGIARARRRRQEVKELRQQAERSPARRPERREVVSERPAAPARPRPEPSEHRTAVQSEERTTVQPVERTVVRDSSTQEPPHTVRREASPADDESRGPDEHFESAPRER